MFVVIVDFDVNMANRAEFLAAVKRQARDSLEKESACIRFDVCIDRSSPPTILLYEIYADACAFDAHLETAHFKSFDQKTKNMIAAKRIRTLTLESGGGRT